MVLYILSRPSRSALQSRTQTKESLLYGSQHLTAGDVRRIVHPNPLILRLSDGGALFVYVPYTLAPAIHGILTRSENHLPILAMYNGRAFSTLWR